MTSNSKKDAGAATIWIEAKAKSLWEGYKIWREKRRKYYVEHPFEDWIKIYARNGKLELKAYYDTPRSIKITRWMTFLWIIFFGFIFCLVSALGIKMLENNGTLPRDPRNVNLAWFGLPLIFIAFKYMRYWTRYDYMKSIIIRFHVDKNVNAICNRFGREKVNFPTGDDFDIIITPHRQGPTEARYYQHRQKVPHDVDRLYQSAQEIIIQYGYRKSSWKKVAEITYDEDGRKSGMLASAIMYTDELAQKFRAQNTRNTQAERII